MRIRTVKPEFWRNRKLAELGREVHGFAARLLNAADDYGFFEADVALIAGDLLPFDADAQRFIRKAMGELERVGFVEVRGGELGVAWVPGFTEHQRINRPTPSRLQPRFQALTEESGKLTEDSQQLTEDSESLTAGKEQGKEEERKGNMDGAPHQRMPDELATVWNETTAAPLPHLEGALGKTRRKTFAAALARRPLEQWVEVFKRINASDFCRGAKGSWVADVDWAVRPDGAKPETARKVLEGCYDNRAGAAPPSEDLRLGKAEVPAGSACAVCGGPAEASLDGDERFGCYPCIGRWLKFSKAMAYPEPWLHVVEWIADERNRAEVAA